MAPTRDDNARDKRSVLRPAECPPPGASARRSVPRRADYGKTRKSKFLYGPVSPNFCARRSVMMILNLSESLAEPLVMAELNMAYLSSLNKRAKLLSSYLPVSPSRYSVPPALHRTIWCRSTFGPRGPGLSNPTSFLRPVLPMAPKRDDNARDKRSVLRPAECLPPGGLRLNKKIEIFIWSRISKFLRPAQRYDDFKLIRITCQAACHGRTEHGINKKFEQTSKTAVVLLAGVTISGTPCPRHFTVPFGAEAPLGHVAQA